MRQGERGREMFVILSGRVRVVRQTADGGSITLAELGPGEGVGEIGLVDERPRTATVIAIEPTEALELDTEALAALYQANPQFKDSLTRVLIGRLRAMSESIERELVGSAPPAQPVAAAPVRRSNAEIVARLRAAIAERQWKDVDDLLSPAFTLGGTSASVALRDEERELTAAFTDRQAQVERVLEAADWVIERVTMSGVLALERPDPAGRTAVVTRVASELAFFYRIADGRIAERITVGGGPIAPYFASS